MPTLRVLLLPPAGHDRDQMCFRPGTSLQGTDLKVCRWMLPHWQLLTSSDPNSFSSRTGSFWKVRAALARQGWMSVQLSVSALAHTVRSSSVRLDLPILSYNRIKQSSKKAWLRMASLSWGARLVLCSSVSWKWCSNTWQMAASTDVAGMWQSHLLSSQQYWRVLLFSQMCLTLSSAPSSRGKASDRNSSLVSSCICCMCWCVNLVLLAMPCLMRLSILQDLPVDTSWMLLLVSKLSSANLLLAMEMQPRSGFLSLGISSQLRKSPISYRSVEPSLTNPPISGIFLWGILPTPLKPNVPLSVMKTESMLGALMRELAVSNSSNVRLKAKLSSPLKESLSGTQIAEARVMVWLILQCYGMGQPYFMCTSSNRCSTTGPRWVWQYYLTNQPCPLILKTSRRILNGCHFYLNKYSRVPLLSLTTSWYTSLLSTQEAVEPHANLLLIPIDMAGKPSAFAPKADQTTSSFSSTRFTSATEKSEGMSRPRCGSLARRGLPLAVCLPPMTQAFDPMLSQSV